MNLLERMILADTETWKKDAKCIDEDPNMFFTHAKPKVQAAKEFCEDCSVKRQCLEFAISRKEENGIWGGLDEAERHTLVLRRRRYRAKMRQRGIEVA